MIFRDLI